MVDRDDDGRIRFHYVIVDLIADYINGELRSGDDALEARWVSPAEMNKMNISKVTLKVLKQFFQSA